MQAAREDSGFATADYPSKLKQERSAEQWEQHIELWNTELQAQAQLNVAQAQANEAAAQSTDEQAQPDEAEDLYNGLMVPPSVYSPYSVVLKYRTQKKRQSSRTELILQEYGLDSVT